MLRKVKDWYWADLYHRPITEGHMLTSPSTLDVPELWEHWPEELHDVSAWSV